MVCDKLRLGDEQMKHVAEKVVNYLLKRDYIEVDEREFYIFTFESIFIACINYLTMLIIAIMMNSVLECIVFIGLLKLLRGNMGGIHMGKWYECYIMSSIMVIFVMWSSAHIVVGAEILVIAYAISIIIIVILAPCVHPNNPIATEDIKKYRKKAVIYGVGVMVITFVLKSVGYEKFVTICFYSVVLSVSMLCMGKLKYRKGGRNK